MDGKVQGLNGVSAESLIPLITPYKLGKFQLSHRCNLYFLVWFSPIFFHIFCFCLLGVAGFWVFCEKDGIWGEIYVVSVMGNGNFLRFRVFISLSLSPYFQCITLRLFMNLWSQKLVKWGRLLHCLWIPGRMLQSSCWEWYMGCLFPLYASLSAANQA